MSDIKKLRVDPDKDLKRLLQAVKNNSVLILPTGMEKHFEIAKRKPAEFRDHKPVLGISIGGSNTKVVLASMANGRPVVQLLSAGMNPPSKTHYTEYFDTLLFGNPRIKDFLRNSNDLCVGISIAVPVINGVPCHKIKIPTIDGLIARDYERDAPTHNLKENMLKYFREREVNCKSLFCQFDSIVANHGGASLCDLKPDDRTLLLVCGTGLATAIEKYTVPIGMVDVFSEDFDDNRLLPYEETEGHQYQYSIAGKGLYSLMERAVRMKSHEAGSKLGLYDLTDFFKTASDTKTVIEIWESTLGKEAGGRAGEILSMIGTEAYSELGEAAAAIVERAIAGLANCVAAAIYADKDGDFIEHTVFFEGSIALNENILLRLKSEIRRRISTSPAYNWIGIPRPPMPSLDNMLMPVMSGCRSITENELRKVDLTVIGAVTAAIAEEILFNKRHP